MASSSSSESQFGDLPESIVISCILSRVRDVRSRNRMALVCRRWRAMERATREALTLRSNATNTLLGLGMCFWAVTELDLSCVSPWGHPLLESQSSKGLLNAHRLAQAFPAVTRLAVYARTLDSVRVAATLWPRLRSAALVRFHGRSSASLDYDPPLGSEILPLLQSCRDLQALDLSRFYCWTEDVPHALLDPSAAAVAAGLRRLELMQVSPDCALRAPDLGAVADACPGLEELRLVCVFNPAFMEFVADDDLALLASRCPHLRLLHLLDSCTQDPASADDAQDDGSDYDDDASAAAGGITRQGLERLFYGLPDLEDLALHAAHSVPDTGPAFAVLGRYHGRLRSLRVGRMLGLFHGQAQGLAAACAGLESLSIRACSDVTDSGLELISRACTRLRTLHLRGCGNVTELGVAAVAGGLRRTLRDVSLSLCRSLRTGAVLRALRPLQPTLARLHVDCLWDMSVSGSPAGPNGHAPRAEPAPLCSSSPVKFFDFMGVTTTPGSGSSSASRAAEHRPVDDMAVSCRAAEPSPVDDMAESCRTWNLWGNSSGQGCSSSSADAESAVWRSLTELSVHLGVGEVLTPLAGMLGRCPVLEEVRVQVVGDCRARAKPRERACGLGVLAAFPELRRLRLDCSETVGFILTAPAGSMDLSLWERWYLNGISQLRRLEALDYWPPQDREMHRRGLSLPSAGLLSECASLRRLRIHGTVQEHFLVMLLRIPDLRDVQLREDFYPAHDDDASTEMRADSCWRFEQGLAARGFSD